jgi:hypothetical protein
MSKSFRYSLLTVVLSTASAVAQPTLTPPVAVGPDTISSDAGNAGFYDYFTQDPPDAWKGDIAGITSGPTYWVYVTGIDATKIKSGGQTVRFTIWDAEQASSLKGLAITFSLNNPQQGGVDFLQAFQTGDNAESSQNLAPGTLASGKFDLRFSFVKDADQTPWTVTPQYRLSEGEWTEFFDGSLEPNVAFNFSAAKLQAGFINAVTSPSDSISFDNFFLVGPILPPITAAYVDDDWAELEEGTVVFFPGSNNVQVYGQNAFSNIQQAIFAVANLDDTIAPLGKVTPSIQADETEIGKVFIAPGTYVENIFLPFHIDLIGSGSGDDPEVDTIIQTHPEAAEVSVISIIGFLARGSSAEDVLLLKDLRVTGANDASGITVNDFIIIDEDIGNIKVGGNVKRSRVQGAPQRAAGDTETRFITFDNVTSIGNEASGIVFDTQSFAHDIKLLNSSFLNNGLYGVDVPNQFTAFSELVVDGCQISNNGSNGLRITANGADNITVANSSFESNGTIFSEGGPPGDIFFDHFNGNASFSNLEISGSTSWFGILLNGYLTEGGPFPAGTVSFNGVSVEGQYYPGEGFGSGIILAGYSDISNMTFSDVSLAVDNPVPNAPLRKTSSADDTAVAPEIIVATNLLVVNSGGELNLGNTTFGGTASFDIVDFSETDIDATNATFSLAENDFDIEDRVVHAVDTDEFGGLVTWKINNLYITVNSFIPSYSFSPLLERPINAATTNDTINVAPQEFFFQPMTISKTIVIRGQGTDQSYIYANGSTGPTGDSRAWFLVGDTDKLEVQSITFDGDEYTIHEAFRMYNGGTFTDVRFRNIDGGAYQGTAILSLTGDALNVVDCTFENIGRTGVRYAVAASVASTYSGNTYTGKNTGNQLDYAVVLENGANVLIQNANISQNLGVRLPPEAGLLLKNGPEAGFPASTIASDTSSAGILILSQVPQGTVAHITNSTMFNNVTGVQIGENINDGSFVLVNGGSYHSNQYGFVAHSALYLNIELAEIYNNSVTGIDICNLTVMDIDKNQIYANNLGISTINSFGEIDNNIINENGNGIAILDEASTEITINGNDFCSHEGVALLNEGITFVDATENWWGSPDGPGGDGTGSGDAIDGNVDYTNFETSAHDPESPCALFALCVRDGDVNNNGALSPADALGAFKIFLNDETLPPDVNVPDFSCEIAAADVNCSESVSPADALAIFQRFLDENPPSECFAEEEVPQVLAKGVTPSIYFSHNESEGESKTVVVSFNVLNFDVVRAFGLRIEHPENLRFLGLERTALTSSWTQLDATSRNGHVTIGGFTVEQQRHGGSGEIIQLRFEVNGEFSVADIKIVETVDDLGEAIVLSAEEGVAQSTPLPTEFGLDQNYPNPFNPSTRISFQIPAQVTDGVHVTLKVFNVNGQVIKTLVDENKAPGRYEVDWDGKDLSTVAVPSGTYFYVIQAGDFKETRKMMLIK